MAGADAGFLKGWGGGPTYYPRFPNGWVCGGARETDTNSESLRCPSGTLDMESAFTPATPSPIDTGYQYFTGGWGGGDRGSPHPLTFIRVTDSKLAGVPRSQLTLSEG